MTIVGAGVGIEIAHAQPLPTNPSVVSGTVSVSKPSATSLTVTQTTPTGIVNWSSFSIGVGNRVSFQNGFGATLNRVIGNVPSSINGLLTATGSVYLINPSGIVVGPSGIIKTGGSFVASTRDIADAKFNAGGSLTFSGTSNASVVNLGQIGSSHGDVVLIAKQVENAGSIRAHRGTAAMAMGTEVTIRDQSMVDGKISVSLPAAGGSVRNTGAIRAASVELAANGGNVYALGVNTNSVIKATGVSSSGGRVFLTAKSGAVYVSQKVAARRVRAAANRRVRDGGTIVVTGDAVTLASGAKLDASGVAGGTILVGGDREGGAVPAQNLVTFPVRNAASTVVEQGATLTVNAASGNGGNIVVWSDQTTSFAGAISARGGASVGNGGFAEVSGHLLLDFTGTADLRAPAGKTGTLLLDPSDITISSGSNTATGSGTNPKTYSSNANTSVLNTTTLVTALGTADVVVDASVGSGSGNGDITVNSAVTWSSASMLTLHAKRNIAINADITATNGGLYLYAGNRGYDANFNVVGTPGTITATGAINVDTFTMGQGNWTQIGSSLPGFQAKTFTFDFNSSNSSIGSSFYQWIQATDNGFGSGQFLRAKGGDGTSGNPYQITDVYGLAGIGFSQATMRGTNYKLVNNIDATNLRDFIPIGSDNLPDYFDGILDGQHYTISGLTSTGSYSGFAGLFGNGFSGTVKDLKLTNVTIGGANALFAGTIAAQLGNPSNGTISNVSVTSGTVQAKTAVGGLVGQFAQGAISGSNATNVNVSTVSGSSTANATLAAGGLVGQMASGIITQSYATGPVSGLRSAGGLIGYMSGGSVSQSYATGAVSLSVAASSLGTNFSAGAGGFVGVVASGASITQSYAMGAVSLSNDNSTTIPVGGFVGANGGTINEAYSTGYVATASGNGQLGGFSGANTAKNAGSTGTGTLTSGSFDTNTSGQTVRSGDSVVVTGGLTTANLQGSLPSGFNTVSSGVWSTAADRYPYFAWRFSSTPDVISGIAYSDRAATVVKGDTIGLLAVGASIGTASTGANGYYYLAVDNGSVPMSGVISSLGGSTKGNAFTDSASGTVSGLDIYGGYLRVVSGNANYSTISGNINTALGSNSGSNYLFTTSGGTTVGLNSNTNLEIASSAASLNINQAIAASGTSTVRIRADGLSLASTISTANTTVILTPYTDNRGVTLGGSAAGTLGLSTSDLNHITASTLQIGTNSSDGGAAINSTGAIAVAGVIAPANVTNLVLHSTSTVTQTSGSTVTASKLAASASSLTLNEANSVDTFAASTTGAVSFKSSGSLTIGTVGSLNGVTAGGTALISAGGNLTLASASGTVSAVGSDDALQLVTGGAFTNNQGSSALSVTSGGGRWLVWSQSPTGDTKGSLSYGFKQYNATYGVTSPASSAANGFLYTAAPSLTATLSAGVSKVYDATTAANLTASNYTISGAIDGDTVNVTNSGGSFSQSNVGTNLTVTATGLSIASATNGGATVYGYQLSSTSASSNTASITARTLTINAATDTKTYDGTASSSATPTVSGLQGSDTVTGLGQSFDTKNAGSGKTISVAAGYTIIDGNGGNNYTVATNASIGTINKAALTISAAANTKTYDATAGAVATPTVSGLHQSDTATGLSEAYANKNAGTGKTLTVTGYTINDGNGGNNYNVTTVDNTSGVINQAALTITAATNTKTYDGTNTAVATPTVRGLQGSDTVTGLTETYDNKDAGSGKTISVATYAINDGNSGGNYAVTAQSNDTGVINKAALTLTAASNSKTYDGTTSAAATPTVSGLQGADTVTGLAETYDGKNAGSGKTLSVSAYTINDGNRAGNYTVAVNTNTTGTIAKANLTVNAVTDTKGYDGTVNSSATPTTTGLQSGDSISGLTQTFNTPSVGTGKVLTVGAFTVNDGNSGDNYNVSTNSNGTGVITAQALTVTAGDLSKIQGQADPHLGFTITSGAVVPGDTFTGGLTRPPGESPGTYAIQQGTLALSPNYVLTFVDGRLTIQAAVPTNVYGSFSQSIQQGTDRTGPSQTAFLTGGSQPNTDGPGPDLTAQGNAPPPPLFCSSGDSCAKTPFFQNMQFGQWITFSPQ